MDQAIQDFMQCKKLAIVGVSRTGGNGKKFGNTAHQELKKRGYEMFIVHPEAKEIEGERCYPNLTSLRGMVDGVFICVPPSKAAQVVREAAAAGIKKIWLQQGAQSTEVLAAARELGVKPITGKCILMYASPVRSFHAFHRGFAKLVGQF